MNIKIIIDDLYKNRPTRIYADFAPALRAERQGLKVMHCKEFGKLVSEKYQRMHDISRRIYDVGGISPTIHTMQGGNTELKVAIEKEPFIVASRGRNPENPSVRTAGIKTEQRLEPNTQGVCNTLTSVQKDNYVAEPLAVDEIVKNHNAQAKHQQDLIQTADGVGRTIPAGTHSSTPHLLKTIVDECPVRIRKLTPKECWRLMGFSDEDFAKAESVNSNTQLYKQAGNSIVVNVLMAIFWELLL